MKEKYFNTGVIIKIQQFSWYFSLIYFAVVSIVYFVNYNLAVIAARLGVIYILGITVIKLFVIAEQFRHARLYRFWLLCYTLVFILMATFFLRYIT